MLGEKQGANAVPGNRQPAEPEPFEIAPGIRRAQEAFWRDLPQLLAQKRLRGNWVLYHLDERVGIARRAEELIEKCFHRNLADNECYLAAIAPRSLAPWEVEEIALPKYA